ncbi:hypothetical protein PG995_004887 [Apiospora arundinis]
MKAASGDNLANTTPAVSPAGIPLLKRGGLAGFGKTLATNMDANDLARAAAPATKQPRRMIKSRSSVCAAPISEDPDDGNDDAEDEVQVQAEVDAQIYAEIEAWIRLRLRLTLPLPTIRFISHRTFLWDLKFK